MREGERDGNRERWRARETMGRKKRDREGFEFDRPSSKNWRQKLMIT